MSDRTAEYQWWMRQLRQRWPWQQQWRQWRQQLYLFDGPFEPEDL